MTVELLNEAIAAWKKTREPRWAAVADWATRAELAKEARPLIGAGKKKADHDVWAELEKDEDPRDLPRLVEATLKMTAADAAERIKHLARLDDPRLFTELIKALEAPPWRANVYKAFVNAVIEVLSASRDPRVAPAFSDLSRRYRGIVETSVGDWTGIKLGRAATMLIRDEVKAKPLTPAQAAALAAAEARFPDQLAALKSSATAHKSKQRTDDELLAAIYDAPADDGARLVLADALSERGDLRGELIALQIRHASGARTSQGLAREAELLADAKRRSAWGLPLSQGAEVIFGRGFPQHAQLRPKMASKVKGERAFATVTELGLGDLSPKATAEFLDHPALANLRDVGLMNAASFAKLERKPRAWTTLQLTEAVPKDFVPLLSAVRTLRVDHAWGRLPADAFVGFGAVTELSMRGMVPSVEQLEPFTQLQRLALGSSAAAALALPRMKTLRSLETAFNAGPDPIAGLKLKELTLRYTLPPVELRRLVDAIPGLERLSIGRSLEPSLLPLIEALEGSSLKCFSVQFADATYLVAGTELTLLSLGWDQGHFQDVLTPALEAGRIKVARVIPERNTSTGILALPAEPRLARHDALLGKAGLTLERDWLRRGFDEEAPTME